MPCPFPFNYKPANQQQIFVSSNKHIDLILFHSCKFQGLQGLLAFDLIVPWSMKSTLHIRSTMHQFLSWHACAAVSHMLNQQKQNHMVLDCCPNGTSEANLSNWQRNHSFNSANRENSEGFAGPQFISKEKGYFAAEADSCPGSPGGPTGHHRWMVQHHQPGCYQDSLGGYGVR